MELVRFRDLLSPRPADAGIWEAVIAEHVHMRVGSALPALGKRAVLRCLASFRDRVEGVDSNIGQYWKVREALFAEVELHWRAGGDVVRLVPCFLAARARRDLIEDLRFYCDLRSPRRGSGESYEIQWIARGGKG